MPRPFAVALTLLLAGCGPGFDPALDDSVADLELATQTAELSSPRAPARGLMTRGWSPGSPGARFAALIRDVVVQVDWAELEASGEGTASGGYFAPGTMGWARLEAALAQGLTVRLRLRAGAGAPAYVKRIGFVPGQGSSAGQCPDGGVWIYNRHDDRHACVPQFWRPWVLSRYQAMMREVARRHGAHPGLREVVASACMTLYAEPFYRAHGDTDSNQRLLDAGLTAGKDAYCHQQALLIHQRVFPEVRTSLAVNGWDRVDPTSPTRVRMGFDATHDFLEGTGAYTRVVDRDGAPTSAVWPGARALLGARLVLQNNGLGENEACALVTDASARSSAYCYLARVAGQGGHSVGFQTETMARLRQDASGAIVRSELDGVRLVLEGAVAMGAAFVELPSGFEKWTDAAGVDLLERYDALLSANAP